MPRRTREEEDRRQHLDKVIAGSLRACINDHGPITPGWIGSAAKRASAVLVALEQQNIDDYQGQHRGVQLP